MGDGKMALAIRVILERRDGPMCFVGLDALQVHPSGWTFSPTSAPTSSPSDLPTGTPSHDPSVFFRPVIKFITEPPTPAYQPEDISNVFIDPISQNLSACIDYHY